MSEKFFSFNQMYLEINRPEKCHRPHQISSHDEELGKISANFVCLCLGTANLAQFMTVRVIDLKCMEVPTKGQVLGNSSKKL